MLKVFSALIVILALSLSVLAQTETSPNPEAKPVSKPAKKTAAKKKETAKEQSEEDAEAEADSAEGLTPYIEVEKYDAAKPLKERADDRFSIFAKYNTNNFDAEERTTLIKTNFSTSSDLNIGFEYVKALNDSLSIRSMAMLSHFYSPKNTLVAPTIEESEKDQGAVSLGLRYIFTQDNYIDFSLNYQPHYYFLLNTDTGNYVLRNNPSPSASLGMKNFFYDTTEASVGLDLGFEIISNSEETSQSAAYYAGLIYRQNFKTGDNVSVEFMYKSENSQVAQYKLTNQAFSLSFMYSLPY